MKPRRATPLSAIVMAELAVEAGFPEGAINVDLRVRRGRRRGVGVTSGRRQDQLHRLDRGRAPDPRRRRERLPQGHFGARGQEPSLVFADADLGAAVPASVWWNLLQRRPELRGPQPGVRPARGPRRVRREVRGGHRQLVIGDPMDRRTHVGSLISPSIVPRGGVHSSGIEEGAGMAVGGSRPDAPASSRPATSSMPTVLDRRDATT